MEVIKLDSWMVLRKTVAPGKCGKLLKEGCSGPQGQVSSPHRWVRHGNESRLQVCSTEQAEKHTDLLEKMSSSPWLIKSSFISMPDPYHKPFMRQNRENLTHASYEKFSKIAKNLEDISCYLLSVCTDFNLESHNFSTTYFIMRWILWRDFKCPVQGHTSWRLGLNSIVELYMPNHDAVFFFLKFINSTTLLSPCVLIL